MLPITRAQFDPKTFDSVVRVLISGWVSKGQRNDLFAEKLRQFLGVKFVVLCSSGTAALYVALASCGIGAGDEVLVADYTFPATAFAVSFCGAKPIFVDVKLDTFNIDVTDLARKVTENSRAIIPVYTFGQPANMDGVMRVADKFALAVIEDAACALGASYDGKMAGTIGDVGCFSFGGRKVITTGEGGALVTDDASVAKIAEALVNLGRDKDWKFLGTGFNFKMSDIAAAVGVCQLERIDAFLQRRQMLAKIYNRRLKHVKGVATPKVHPKAKHIFQSYVILLDSDVDRGRLMQKMRERGIETQTGTYACHMIKPYVDEAESACPNSAAVFERALTLPMYPSLRMEDAEYVAGVLKELLD